MQNKSLLKYFLPSVINDWNVLSLMLDNVDSLTAFKSYINRDKQYHINFTSMEKEKFRLFTLKYELNIY